MKKLYIFLLAIISVTRLAAQCGTNTQITHISCYGACDGQILLMPTSGHTPYSLAMDGQAPALFVLGDTVGALCAGMHHYVLSDSLSACIDSGDVSITEPAPINVTSMTIPVTCMMNAVTLAISGGFPPYTALWQTGDTGMTVYLSAPGIYGVTVTDANGCTATWQVVNVPNPPIVISFTAVNPSCASCPDGVLTPQVSGGTPPFTYQWTPGLITSAVYSNLVPGNYRLCVVDAMGCANCASYTLLDSSQHLVSGRVYFDLNNNGSYDSGEPPMNNQYVSLVPGSFSAWTATDGSYYFITPGGTYTDTLETRSGWHVSSTPVSYAVNLSTGNIANLDFGIYPDSVLPVFVQSTLTSGNPRCNNNVAYTISINNLGTQPANGYVQLNADPLTSYVHAYPAADSVSGNSVFWNYSSLIAGTPIQIYVTLHLPGPGSFLNHVVMTFATDSLGNNLDSSSYSLNQVVSCSYDPNDKSVNPPGVTVSNFTQMDSWLDYMIRFQNKGNDTAYDVMILDTLNPNLDIASFQVLGSSHLMNTTVENNSIIQFHFNHIMLPDSGHNEPASHGWVSYRIKALPGLPDPIAINNTAHIYFDQNLPVATNTTLNTMTLDPLRVSEINLDDITVSIYPNPAKQVVTVKIRQAKAINCRVQLLDALGQLVKDCGTVRTPVFTLDKLNQKPGNYFLRMQDTETGKTHVEKLVIE